MQIVVNTRLLLKDKLEGIGWFSYQTLKLITRRHPEVHFVFLFDRPFDESFIFSDNITPMVLSPQARHPFLYMAWFQWSVKGLLNRMRPDLFLSPDGMLSLGAHCPQLPVIHDLNFRHNPQDVRPLTRRYYNHYFPRFAAAASRIATVSEYSKQDIIQSYHIAPEKIDVVYNGINEGFVPLDPAQKQGIRDQFAKGQPYFLFVGSLHPRKNVPRLIEAFFQFKKATGSPKKLVLAGPAYWGMEPIHEALQTAPDYKDDVILTGRLQAGQLTQVMGAADALTYVPYFEGFGIPLVEAMACDVPIISSNCTSMPEIAGKAALYVDPMNPAAIAQAMQDLENAPQLRQQLVEAGRQQQHLFSWEQSANRLWTSVEKAL